MGQTFTLAVLGTVVVVVLGLGIAVFVIPRAPTLSLAAVYGALLGFVIHGVYDFTNDSTLRQWPFAVVLADVAWGAAGTARARWS